MTWSMTWGPIHKATTDGKSVPEEGDVKRGGSTGGLVAPSHAVNYNATDARHGHENNIGGAWPSIDHNSGPVTEHDWGKLDRPLPRRPRPWRQT